MKASFFVVGMLLFALPLFAEGERNYMLPDQGIYTRPDDPPPPTKPNRFRRYHEATRSMPTSQLQEEMEFYQARRKRAEGRRLFAEVSEYDELIQMLQAEIDYRGGQ